MSRGALGVALSACVLVLGACTSETRIYEGFDSDAVWRAMVTAAKEPQYPDWKVTANDVWVDEAQHRIEVLRLVRRIYIQPTAPAHFEERTWRFQMSLVHPEPPQATFVSRGFGMPTEAQAEALRYFADMQDVLLGSPGEVSPPQAERAVMDSVGLDDERPEPAGRPGEPADDAEPQRR